jgi:hypothetical protein
MIKLSLGELEEAIANPRAFREKVVNRSTDDSFRPKSYYSQLRNAIFKFHIFGNNAIEGEEYLTTKLFEFTNDTRKKEILDQYNWYVTDIKTNSTRVFGCRYLISIRYLQGITVDLELTGEVGRLDINPSGGYAAWLFRRNKSENWADELRMPLIQEELSKRLNAFLICRSVLSAK